MKILDFAFAADEKYVMPLRVAVASLLRACRHNPRQLIVHVLDLGISDSNWDALIVLWTSIMPQARFERHLISATKYANYKLWNGSVAAYARLELPLLLPNVKWCMYFDCDVLVVKDPSELEQLTDTCQAIYGHLNYGVTTRSVDGPWLIAHNLPFDINKYVCSGVILVNLQWFRENVRWRSCFEFLNRYPDAVTPDQMALNVICFGNIGLLPSSWGQFSVEAEELEDVGCLHYSGKNPWRAHSGWFYFCGEHLLERVWRKFAVSFAGCSRHDFEQLSVLRCVADSFCSKCVTLAVWIACSVGINLGKKRNRQHRFLKRCNMKIVDKIEDDIFGL